MWVKVNCIPKPETMTAVTAHKQDFLVALIDGELFCAQNHCPHEGVPLTLGCLKNKRVQCSLHGFSFDLTTGDSGQADVDNLKTYPIKQQNNQIYINI